MAKMSAAVSVFRMVAIAIALVHPSLAQSQPVVDGSSGQWTHRSTVQVVGRNFGPKATAAPVVWDDASGTNISEKWDGAWPDTGSYKTGYRTPQRGINLPHTNVARYIAGGHGDDSGYNSGYNVLLWKVRSISSYPSYSYISWYERADDNWVFGGDNNYKTFDYSTGDSPYNATNWYINYCCGMPNNRSASTEYSMNDVSGTSWMNPDMNGHNNYWGTAINPHAGAWTKVEMEISYTNQTNGYIKLWENGVLKMNYRGPTDRWSGTQRTEAIGGYARMSGQPANWRYFADVYLDYSRARIVLGNASTLAQSTIREVQPLTAWSGTSATVTVNLGKFGPGQTAYIHVVDSNGVSSQAGHPITVGGSVTLALPSQPRNLRVTPGL